MIWWDGGPAYKLLHKLQKKHKASIEEVKLWLKKCRWIILARSCENLKFYFPIKHLSSERPSKIFCASWAWNHVHICLLEKSIFSLNNVIIKLWRTLAKMSKFWFSKSFFSIKNGLNLSNFFFLRRIFD